METNDWFLSLILSVTRPIYESRVNWVIDPAPPASRRPATKASPAPTPAILMPPSGASSQPPRRQKSRRRRRRKAARTANQNSASRQADLATPDVRSANDNSVHWRATQPRSAANDRPEMRSTSVEHPHSSTSSPLTQLPIPTATQNSGTASCQDHSEIWGLYKPAQTHPREDSTATLTRDNISGLDLSSPALQQPSTKTFSGLPARLMTSPYREAGDADRERPGIVYPLLPRAARPDTRLQIDCRKLPPLTVDPGRPWCWTSQRPACRRTASRKDHVYPGTSPTNAAATARLESTDRRSARPHKATGVNRIHHFY